MGWLRAGGILPELLWVSWSLRLSAALSLQSLALAPLLASSYFGVSPLPRGILTPGLPSSGDALCMMLPAANVPPRWCDLAKDDLELQWSNGRVLAARRPRPPRCVEGQSGDRTGMGRSRGPGRCGRYPPPRGWAWGCSLGLSREDMGRGSFSGCRSAGEPSVSLASRRARQWFISGMVLLENTEAGQDEGLLRQDCRAPDATSQE